MKWIKSNFLLVLLILFIILFIIYAAVMLHPKTIDQKTWGVWGDAFGMFNGLAFLIAMYALYLQKKEMKETAIERRKAEDARKKREYANVTFQIIDQKYSDKFQDSVSDIAVFKQKYKNNYIEKCKEYFNLMCDDLLDEKYGNEIGTMYRNVVKSVKYHQGFFHKLYILLKSGIIDIEFIRTIIFQKDYFVFEWIKPILYQMTFEDLEMLKYWDSLFIELGVKVID